MPLRRRIVLALLVLLSLIGSACAQSTVTRIPDIVYRKKEGVALTLDVFKPKHPNGIGVLWMVSGGWVSNHESINPGLAEIFARHGITLFQVVHGTQPRFKLLEIQQDILRAVRFVRAHAAEYGVDPERLGISGGSAGGHLSLVAGAFGTAGDPSAKDPVDRVSSRVQAIACFFPPTDFLNYGKEGAWAYDFPMLKGYWPAFGITEKTTRQELETLARMTSPIYGDLAHLPPTFIIHGDADLLVPLQQSQRFVGAAKVAGASAQLLVMPGKAHGWPGIENDADLLASWLQSQLARK
jgi:acetyl esterase/lipase